MEDKRQVLRAQQPFSYREIKDQKIQVFFHGKLIKILTGREYAKFQRVLDLADTYQTQMFLAKVTGNFKHGNERAI